MFSCLNFGKSHKKDASEPGHCSSAKPPSDGHVLIRAICAPGKESAFYQVHSGHGPRDWKGPQDLASQCSQLVLRAV